MNHRTIALLGTLWIVGCARFDSGMDADSGFEQRSPAYLRIDVHPSETTFRVGRRQVELLSHTFLETAFAEPLQLELRPAVEVSGTVTGFAVTPYAMAELPGTSRPVTGTVSLRRSDSAQTRTVRSDEEGRYSLLVVPEAIYDLTVVPDDPAIPFGVDPLYVDSDRPLRHDLDLGAGVALWGRIVGTDGRPFVGARVFSRAADGTTGTPVLTEGDGTFVLRVPPGTHQLISRGRDNGRDPTIRSEPVVVGPEGRALDLVFPPLTYVSVGGRVTDGTTGRPIVGATVRLEASALDGAEGNASMSVDVTTNNVGVWDSRVLPGTWHVQILPGDRQAFAPVELEPIEVSGDRDLGTEPLEPFVDIDSLVLDAQGDPVPGAIVTATEIGFGGRRWATVADQDGRLVVALPAVPVELTLVPPGGYASRAAMTRLLLDPGEAATRGEVVGLWFVSGRPISGTVRVEGVPVPLAVVEVRDDKNRLIAATSTDRDGHFVVRVAGNVVPPR